MPKNNNNNIRAYVSLNFFSFLDQFIVTFTSFIFLWIYRVLSLTVYSSFFQNPFPIFPFPHFLLSSYSSHRPTFHDRHYLVLPSVFLRPSFRLTFSRLSSLKLSLLHFSIYAIISLFMSSYLTLYYVFSFQGFYYFTNCHLSVGLDWLHRNWTNFCLVFIVLISWACVIGSTSIGLGVTTYYSFWLTCLATWQDFSLVIRINVAFTIQFFV